MALQATLPPETEHRWAPFIKAFVLILLLKLLYLSSGMHVQPDSDNYLLCVSHYDYPAAYPLFLRFLQSFSENFYLIGIMQSLLFALAGAWFVTTVTKNKVLYQWLTGILAAEPMTGFFASSIMSEGLYIPVILIWLGLWYKQSKSPQNWRLVVLLGLTGGLLYSIRFAAIFPVLLPVVLWLFSVRKDWKRILWGIPVYILAFQLVLVPLRLHNQKVFGTYQLNGLTGATIWNNAAFLYPESQVQREPQNEFESFLELNGDKYQYDNYLSINSNQLWKGNLAYRNFINIHHYQYENTWKAHQIAGETGRRLIQEKPGKYLTGFVFPNMIKTFYQIEEIDTFHYTFQYRKELGAKDMRPVLYTPFYWIVLVSLLLLATIFAIVLKFKDIRFKQWSWIIWMLILAMPFLAPTTLRYYYSYAFLIPCLIAVMLVNREEE